ncbi:MAG: c-type cytochrome [Myxococcales bacterium]|nr:c-type cytochrome [Myxococcales bacterium]
MCHTLTGEDSLGPTLKGIYGQLALLADGKKRLRDDAYFRQKIRRSDTIELAGDRNVMPIYKDTFSKQQLDDIIAFLKHLR